MDLYMPHRKEEFGHDFSTKRKCLDMIKIQKKQKKIYYLLNSYWIEAAVLNLYSSLLYSSALLLPLLIYYFQLDSSSHMNLGVSAFMFFTMFIFMLIFYNAKSPCHIVDYFPVKHFLSWVMGCSCNPATLEAGFQNRVGSIPVGGNSPSVGGWILWPPVI